MADKNSDLLARLLATFRIEADEHVKAISKGLLALEKLPAGEQQDTTEAVFREAHSLKGAARAVKFSQIEAICQPFESVLAALRDRKISLSTSLADLLHQAVSLIESLAASGLDLAAERQTEVASLARQLERVLSRAQRAPKPEPAPPRPSPSPAQPQPDKAPALSSAKTVRVSTQKLDAVMHLSEEMLVARLSVAQLATDIQLATAELSAWRKRSMDLQVLLRPLERDLSSSAQAAGGIRKLLDYFADEQVRVRSLEDQLARISRMANSDRRILASMTDDLQQRIREMQLLPCSTLLDMFARQARELAREQGKMVNVSTQGSDIEVDRRLMDEIKDPLIHLARNCIDHGIESPPRRKETGKPAAGEIRISVSQKDSGKIIIAITDDGPGVDIQRLKSAAIERDIISPEEAEALTDLDALHLIFTSGLSTSALITDVSGRGLGMAIVRDKIEQLGGHIDVISTPNAGTQFQILLPVSLATFRGTLVSVADQLFIAPSANVDRVLRIAADTIHSVNNSDMINIDGQALPLVWLSDVLRLPRQAANGNGQTLAIVLGRNASRIAFRVDSVLDEQEVLVKGLGPQLRRVNNIAGACVLGNGQVVPVLNVPDLLQTAVQLPAAALAISRAPATQARQSILVVEDSITSRSLMKNILETAGFRVVTAVDGIEAYTTLKTEKFDLVVSDVDMPRMNGFDLTAKLRADSQLKEIPIVLVTTLDSREDRERGIDVGANAYIVKSSFDQSNLLEVIQRLI
jgi:two-component system chemotaxis sensor kinase CheA